MPIYDYAVAAAEANHDQACKNLAAAIRFGDEDAAERAFDVLLAAARRWDEAVFRRDNPRADNDSIESIMDAVFGGRAA